MNSNFDISCKDDSEIPANDYQESGRTEQDFNEVIVREALPYVGGDLGVIVVLGIAWQVFGRRGKQGKYYMAFSF